MNDRTQPRNLRDAVHGMLLAVAPERTAELQSYWNEYSPQFQILEDDGPDGPIVLDAGGFVHTSTRRHGNGSDSTLTDTAEVQGVLTWLGLGDRDTGASK
ncbi:hypothetical protein D7U89_15180 [Stenotrophomonas maltophilia]|nr:hypothetical protein [Stenotrophomonas maltophilia]MBA0403036.1 hypothetical protein [Stenotrophomonas maltophilia]